MYGDYALARPNETKLQAMIDEGLISYETVALALMAWVSDDDLCECMEQNGIFEEE